LERSVVPDKRFYYSISPHRAWRHEELVLLHSVQKCFERTYNLREECQKHPHEHEYETGLDEVQQGYKNLTLLAGKVGDGVFLLGGESPPSSAC